MNKLLLRSTVIISVIMILLFALTGCREKQNIEDEDANMAAGSFPLVVTDIYGSSITIKRKPERIVALAPSTVEILYKLGLGDNIVGVADYCDYPPESGEKARVGDCSGVNIEKVVELNPDIVFAGSGMSKEACRKLTSFNIRVVAAEARSLEEIPGTFMLIGKVMGTFDEAKALGDEVASKISRIRDKVRDSYKIRTYYAISYGKEGNWTCGRGTFISDLIDMAGGKNIADDVEGWREYSLEKIVEKDPELILISAMVASGNKDILDNEKGYNTLSAIKNDRVLIVDDDITQRPGPRIVEGLELIARAIHPEVFN